MALLKRAKLAYEVQLLGRTLLSKKTPVWTKVMAGVALAYTLSPVDILPDVLPVVGIMDDVAFLTAAGFTLARVTKVIRDEWRKEKA